MINRHIREFKNQRKITELLTHLRRDPRWMHNKVFWKSFNSIIKRSYIGMDVLRNWILEKTYIVRVSIFDGYFPRNIRRLRFSISRLLMEKQEDVVPSFAYCLASPGDSLYLLKGETTP